MQGYNAFFIMLHEFERTIQGGLKRKLKRIHLLQNDSLSFKWVGRLIGCHNDGNQRFK